MKHYLHKFANQAAYTTAKSGQDFYLPAVSLIESGMSVIYDSLPVVPEGFVDFDLPSGTLWYNKNLGATNGNTSESWYGDLYAWGELGTKETYTWETYRFGSNSENLTKYNTIDNKTTLDSEDDIATITNTAWNIPTKVQAKELVKYTISNFEENYQSINNLNGILFVKAIITQEAFKRIPLYWSLTHSEFTDEQWSGFECMTLEEVNKNLSFLGEDFDIRTTLYKDSNFTQLAEYSVDYICISKQVDLSSSTHLFIPYYDEIIGYWCSTLKFEYGINLSDYFSFDNNVISVGSIERCNGCNIRPVITPAS